MKEEHPWRRSSASTRTPAAPSSAASTSWPTRSRSPSARAGRNVVLDKKFGAPTITNDGVTIAREVELEDPYENLGAQLAKAVATKTNDVAGDGTTTATVLAQALVHEGLRNVAAGANPGAPQARHRRGRQGRQRGAARARPRPVDGEQAIAHVATISAQDATIGELIAEAFDKVGKDGVITVEESPDHGHRARVHRGHAVRQGLHLAVLRDRPGAAWRRCSRTRTC